MLSRSDLYPYQNRAVEFILENQRGILSLEMGLGKTASTLTAITDLIDGLVVSRVLVIAPLRVADSVWAQETANWGHTKHLRVSVCTGSEKHRIGALYRDADIYIINRENVPWLVELYKDKWPFDIVVIDESSSFKNPSSKRFKALKRVSPKTEYMVLLTGTPSPNGLLDLWAQMYLVDFGLSLGRTFTSYKQRWFEADDYMGYRLKPRKGAEDQIYQAIQSRVLSMKAADYLQLPERIETLVPVQLSPKLMREYQTLEKEFLLELENADIEAFNAGALINKLLQFCNGALYDDTGAWHEIHTAKLDALADIIDDNPGENILIAYNYRADLDRLKKRFPQAVVLDKDPRTIERWNRGEIPLLLAHPASAGHGLNLQHGGALAVWFGLNWSLELDQQFNARLHRQGQTRPVRIVRLVAAGCADERVCSVIGTKAATQDRLLQAVKAA